MIATDQSGVIACHSVPTTRPGAQPEIASSFKAWPEIRDWLTYYTLVTIGAYYQPDEQVLPAVSPEESLIRSFPKLARYKDQFMPMVEEFYRLHFGAEHDARNFEVAINYVTAKLLHDEGNLSATDNEWWAESSPEDVVAKHHEYGHLYSLQIIRPAITHLKATASAIEDLLQQAAAGSSDGFWDKFTDLHSKLKACLTNSLALEELRATIMALYFLPTLREEFIDQVYGGENKNISRKECKTFHRLYSLTGGNLRFAHWLTLLAECLNPRNPEGQLNQILDTLKEGAAHTWSEERWYVWFETWERNDAWQTAVRSWRELTTLLNLLTLEDRTKHPGE
jgi:hypothetical protein